MRPSHDDPSPSEIEQKLYDADQFLDGLFPQSEGEVAETMAMFGTTPVELPEHLRNAETVLKRIVKREPAAPKPSVFGKLVTMLRTENKLSIEQLAQKTDLDADDLRRIESESGNVASPLAVSVLADYFTEQLAIHRNQPEVALKLLDVGEYPIPDTLDMPSLASMMQVIETIYNLEEAITKS